MEKNSDNPMHELDKLKQQYKFFNQNLEGQQIVDTDKVQYVVNNCSSHFQRHRRNVLICYPLAMVLFAGCVLLVGGHVAYAVLSAMFLLLGMVAELWITKNLSLNSNKVGLVEWAQQHYAAKRIFLLYYLTLICSLYYIIFIVCATLDVPNHMVGKVTIAIAVLFGLSLVGFLMLYLPIYRQCNEVLCSVKTEVDKSGAQNRGFHFLGLVVLFFIAVTAALKLLHLPGATLVMLFAAVLIVAYAIVGAVRLRLRRHCPIILSILLVLVVPLMTYLVIARINHWPLGGHNRYSYYVADTKNDSLSTGDMALVEVCTNYRPDLSSKLCSTLQHSGIESALLSDSPALIAVPAADTAQVNVLLAANFSLKDGLTTRWSLPDIYGKCMLYLVHSSPIVSTRPGEPQMIDRAYLMRDSQKPLRLEINLRPQAETIWQAAVFQFVQRQSPTTVAVVFHNAVICQGVVDRDLIGYQRLCFKLSPNSSISESLLDDMTKGK